MDDARIMRKGTTMVAKFLMAAAAAFFQSIGKVWDQEANGENLQGVCSFSPAKDLQSALPAR